MCGTSVRGGALLDPCDIVFPPMSLRICLEAGNGISIKMVLDPWKERGGARSRERERERGRAHEKEGAHAHEMRERACA